MGLFDIFKKKENQVEELEAIPVRQSLAEFFSIDIHNLNQYLSHDTDNGLKYTATVQELNNDMGLFKEAIIKRFKEDGSYQVELWADRTGMTSDLSEFVTICCKLYGPTKGGEGEITQRDYTLIERGAFSRLWDKVWVDMSTNEDGNKVMTITLFNPEQY